MPRASIRSVVRKLGLTGGCQCVLDAGDINSYNPASPQIWSDSLGVLPSPFVFGDTNAGAANDPTFNGVAGRNSSGEFMSFDGGDMFRYGGAASEPWMQNLHKDNAIFTIAMWANFPVISGYSNVWGTGDGYGQVGISLVVKDVVEFNCSKGTGAQPSLAVLGPAIVPNKWAFYAVSVNEGTGAGLFMVNGVAQAFNATYLTPSAGGASQKLVVGGANNPGLQAGSKIANFVPWSGRALKEQELRAYYLASRKFGG